jgi:arylformamidase
MPQKLIDISRTISGDAVVWPDDEPLRHSLLSSIGPGCPCQVTKLEGWSTHFLTHMDAPAHFIAGAATLDTLPLARFICPATVTEIEPDAGCVEIKHIADLGNIAGEGVLFKTRNSRTKTEAVFDHHFAYIAPDAAQRLVEKKAKLVGIDYLSVDPAASTDYPTHYKLLGNDVLILEGLDLKDAAPGKYMLYALPLKIRAADGSPVRAVLASP